jgi:acetyl-CoA carboxylase biotin carboxylase subunit
MIGKLIVYGKDRIEAIERGKRALGEFILDGIKTTIPLHLRILDNHKFRSGEFSTDFIDRHFK